jgi:signal transduction histidine kinase
MNTLTRLIVAACLLVAVGTTALLLQSWVDAAAQYLPPSATPREAATRLSELARRERLALAALTVAALAAVTVAAALPAARPSEDVEGRFLARQGVELLAQAAATQSAALARERGTRERVEENLALEQLRAGQAVADRARLGRDLHDGIAQTLYAAGLVLASARQKITADPVRAAALLDQGVVTLNAGIRDVRACIDGVAEARRAGGSFAAAVRAITEMLGSGREVTFDLSLAAAGRLAETQYADLLGIVREAVSNALRHGAAKKVAIRLHEDADRLCLLVQDDGRGFDLEKTSAVGHGLANLRARAGLLRGELRVTSAPGTGTRVVLTLPVLEPGRTELATNQPPSAA